MKPTADNIIIRAALDQKETIVFGTLKLYVPFKSQYNSNEREGNPVLAEVMVANGKFPDIKAGDILLLHHGTITNKAARLWQEENTVTLSIPVDRFVLGKLGTAGEVIPMNTNLVAQRRFAKPISSIIITPDAYRKSDDFKMNVIAVAPDIRHIHAGSTIVCYQYSDYECVYNWNGQEKRAILIYEGDVLAEEEIS